jgi:membrane-bound metal-dependent hydrolase YbcI (DUF457 family)
VTIFEHAMLGATIALAAGVQRRHGWGLVVTAAVAATLPDLDGLTLAFGPAAYATGHRVWGHNFLVAGMTGGLAGAIGYLCHQSTRVRRRLLRRTEKGEAPPASPTAPTTWVAMGCLAGLSHPLVDVIYSGTRQAPWPVALLWPFTTRSWALPLVPWGDLGATLIFIAEMFALQRWPHRARVLAAGTLTALAAYLTWRWLTLAS